MPFTISIQDSLNYYAKGLHVLTLKAHFQYKCFHKSENISQMASRIR